MRPTPPRPLIALLERLLEPRVRDALIGDLIERFEQDCDHGRARDHRHAGVARAHLRLYWESLVALRHFGAPLALLRSRSQESRMSSFLADLRHGVLVLLRAPSFAALCILTLALAIGPTTAILSVVDPLLIRSLPYENPDRLAFIWERDQNGSPTPMGFATIADIRARATQLQSVAAMGTWETTLSSRTEPEKIIGSRVSWNYFQTLGVRMALGRDFVRDEDQVGKSSVVILSRGLWARRFNSDPTIVGRTIDLDGAPYTVAGVLPASYDDVLQPGAQIFRVLGYNVSLPYACRTCRHLRAIARIRPGVPREHALAELNQISSQIVSAYPKEYSGAGMFLTPMQQEVTRAVRPALLAILAAVALVLLIAVANVVNLQIARAVRRDGEFAVRIALGAGAGRLAQQLIAEGLVIAAAGGLLGVVFGKLTLPLLVARLPRTMPRVEAIHLDGLVLAVLAAVVLVLAIVLGLIPAHGARRRVLFSGALRGAARVGSGDHHRTRAMLVVAEVALALLLLASAGLLAKSLIRLLAVDTGFDPENLATMTIQSSGASYKTDALVLDYRRRAMAAARAVPGVLSVATSTSIPLSGAIDRYGITAEDRPLANPELAPYATGYRVDGDFIKTMGIRLVRGRVFDAADMRDSAAGVAIVSASLAKRIWGSGEDPVGKRIHIPNARMQWSTVVGVAGDVRHAALDAEDTRAIYVPEEDWGWASSDAVLVARVRGDLGATLEHIRAAVASLDPTQPITNIRSMDAVVSSSTTQRQLALTLFAAFAILAVLLSAAGIYGVLAGSVAERTREIGVRSALGATPRDLLRMVLRRGLRLAGMGVVLGLAGAFAVTRYLHALLFGIAPTDAAVFASAAALLLGVALVACLVPARRAVRVDPMVALRE